MATLPDCCKDDMADKVKSGMGKGPAMLAALKNHKAGKHDDDEDADSDSDNDGDGD